jgi:hypothetical protein
MRRELFALVGTICLAAAGPSFVSVSLSAQASTARSDNRGSITKAGAPPRTADGRPDLQGTWVNFDSTPLEASSSDDALRLKALAGWFPGIDAPGETRQIRGPNPAPEFVDIGVKRSARRRSMVVDPANGRVPLRKDAEELRSRNLAHLTDAWEHHTPWERCITRGVPGGMFPAGYNNGYVILQTPEYVAIVYEMIHEARIIPLDGRSHIGTNIGLWNGDSRGRWEGDSLVVEITNYRAEPVGAVATGISTTATLKGVPQTRAMRVVERFTRVDLDTLQYEVTIEDPGVYTSAWKVAMPLNRASDYRLFEYACHEGNYGLPNSLSGARADERALQGSPPR